MRNERFQHTHIFSGRVTDRPQLSNIFRCINVSICDIAAVWTTKMLAFSITKKLAYIASLRSVARINYDKRHTGTTCLVFEKGTKLKERPGIMSSSLSFSDRCSFPDVGQILNRNAFVFGYSLFHNSFADGVVGDSGMSLFTPFQPFQKLAASVRAFALNAATHLKIIISNFIQFLRSKGSSVGKGGNIVYTKIHPNKFFNIFNIFFRNFNGLKKVKLTLLINKVCLAFDVWKKLFIVTNKGDFQSSINRPDRYGHSFIGKNTGVIGNSSKRLKESLSFLVGFIGVHNFADAPDNYLSRTTSGLFQVVVNKIVKLELVKNLFLPYGCRNLITGRIRFFYGCQKRLRLILYWEKLYLKCKFHSFNIFIYKRKSRTILKKGGCAIPPPAKAGGLLAQSL